MEFSTFSALALRKKKNIHSHKSTDSRPDDNREVYFYGNFSPRLYEAKNLYILFCFASLTPDELFR